jgi:uncharacterized membrane protein YidH (DUF202 family)
MKWVLVVLLVIIGILAAFVAIEYFVVPIHSLPSYIPGHRPVRGHYHKRGAIAALVALIAFVAAALLAVRFRREDQSTPSTSSAGEMLSGPPATPEGPTQ